MVEAIAPETGAVPSPGRQHVGATDVERFTAAALTVVIAARVSVSPGVPIGFFVAACLLPVTARAVREFRGIPLILLLAATSAVAGLVLTWFAASEGLANHSVAIVQTARVLGLGIGTLSLLWARYILGTRVVVFLYGLSTLASLVLVGVNPANPWKASFSVPIILLALSLRFVYGKARFELPVLVGLAAVSGLNDSRSAAAMLLIAAALVASGGARARAGRRSPALVLVRLTLIVVGGFYLVQAAILDGILGEAVQARTIAQTETSGSVLLGGRPEIGATFALLTSRPEGYGAGAEASAREVLNAKGGMSAIGYDPNNGYVERYMFGNGFEVHSLLGDLWILFGVAGLVLAVALLVLQLSGMVVALHEGLASGVLLYLAMRSLWDFAFSPFPSAMLTLMLALAVALPHRARPGTP